MEHSAEFLRCITELDVAGIRRLWQHVSPHLHQPKSDDEALHTLHLARVKMSDRLASNLVDYSKCWLKERETKTIAHAVGIAVGMHGQADPAKVDKLLNVRGAMEYAVVRSIQDGVHLEHEAVEVKKRMMAARDRA